MSYPKSVGVNTILAVAAMLGGDVGAVVNHVAGEKPAKTRKHRDAYDQMKMDHASTRRLMRLVKQHRAILKGGFPVITLSPMRVGPDHICDSTRADRRRAKLGRA